jgi:tripartite-type tricarboxylate transporter receptor subunit TctC
MKHSMSSIACLMKLALTCSVFGTAIVTAQAQAQAQAWPTAKPITFTVAFAAGSSTDIVARTLGQKVSQALGQSVVVENKPGAGGNIGAQQVKRMAPDGYNILVTSVAYAVNPSLYANAGYDPIADFSPVALGPSTPNIITVHPSLPVNSVKDLIAHAKKEKLAYASSGIGTTTHLSMERLKTAASVEITHVPHQPAAAILAVVAGHTQVSSTSMPPAVPQVKSGKLRALAVTSAQRSPALPDVPTMNEQGFAGFDDLTWFGFFAPAGTPPAVVARLNDELNKAMQSPDIVAKFAEQGLSSRRNTPEEFSAYLRSEIPKWSKAVKDSGAKVD